MLSTQLRDVKLNASHDWDLSSGTFVFTFGLDGVAQAINFAIRMHRGEWFMNLREGFPYFERVGVPAEEAVLGQKGSDARAVAEYAAIIAAVEGVKSIIAISATLVGRTLNVSWTVQVEFDDLAETSTLSGTQLVQR